MRFLFLLVVIAFAITIGGAAAASPGGPSQPARVCDPNYPEDCAPRRRRRRLLLRRAVTAVVEAGHTDPGPAPGDKVGSFEDSVSVSDGGYQTLSANNYTSSSASRSGCRTVTYTRTGKSMLGSVLFRHNLRTYWCWKNNSITQLGVTCYASDVVGLTIQAGGCNISGYYYSWSGSTTGGHYSIGTANYANCILKYGCIGSWNVNAEVWVNGNGTWTGKGT